MTREKSPWDKSIHYKIHAVLYSNTFRIIDDISSVCRCLFAFFFFCQSIIHYQSNSIPWIHMPKEILSLAFFTRSLRSVSTSKFNFASLNLGLLVKKEKTEYLTTSDSVLIVRLWRRPTHHLLLTYVNLPYLFEFEMSN